MAGMNRAQLIGFLGKDPELRFTPAGKAVASFSVATTEKWKDKAGVVQERTEWHNITAWGGTGEACARVLGKGWLVMVEGRIQTEKYANKKHPEVMHYSTKIVADSVQFLRGPRSDAVDPGLPVRGGDAAPDDFGPPPTMTEPPPPSDADIPF